MKRYRIPSALPALIFVCLLPCGAGARADAREDAARMGGVYSNRVEQISQAVREQEKDLLRKFIIALVRVEQSFRDQGDLEGLMATSTLREALISDPHFPEAAEGMPEVLAGLVRTLGERRAVLRAERDKQLKAFDLQYATALEPLQRELTRQGDLTLAMSLRDLRQRLETGMPAVAANPAMSADAGDPNNYPICLEPPGLRERQDLGARTPSQSQEPVAEGNVQPTPGFWRLHDGKLTLPAPSLAAASTLVRQNQMFTLEFALRSRKIGRGQGIGAEPAPILVFGETKENANFMVTQEDGKAFFYLRTSDTLAGKTPFRVDLGRILPDRFQHFVITYRNGDLIVHRNGDEHLRIRKEVTGSLANWVEAPLAIGGTKASTGEDIFWRGLLVSVYLKPSIYSQREIRDAFGRFEAFVTTQPKEGEPETH